MTTTTQSGGQALVAALAAHGVDTVFGIPGTHNLAVYAALAGSGITHVLPCHQQGAGYASAGYARVSGKPGVCITTTGPAILNAAAAAAQAYSDSVPVLFVAPGLPLGHPSNGNGYLHELKNQRGAMDSIVGPQPASHQRRGDPARGGAVLRRDDHRARAPGIPRDPPRAARRRRRGHTGCPRPKRGRRRPTTDAVRRAAALIAAAERPLVIAGGGSSAAAAELRDFAEVLGAPVITTANGKGVLSEHHPLSLGAGLHHPTVAELVSDSDLVVAVGTELAPSDLWYGPLQAEGKLILIDIDPTGVSTNAQPTVTLVGDSAETLRALNSRLEGLHGDRVGRNGLQPGAPA